MKQFNILIVDDDLEQVEHYRRMCAHYPQLLVQAASNLQDARDIIEGTFFHLALVDLDINREPAGANILAFLADHRPTCERILITRHSDDYQTDILKLLDPLRPLANAVVDKRTWHPTLREFLAARVKLWSRSMIQVDIVCDIFREVSAKSPKHRVQATEAEVDYLLSTLYGQGQFRDSTGFELSHVTPVMMTGGRSNSVVLKCQSRTAHHMNGIWTVVKLSPVAEAAEEYLRYSTFVRFLVSLDARVELLGYASGDTLGAICYSFAGKTPNDVRGLNDLFAAADGRAEKVLSGLFSPEAQCWYATGGEELAVTDFINQAYQLGTDVVMKTVSDTIKKLQGKTSNVELRDGGFIWNGIKVQNPLRTLGAGKMLKRYKSCIVHGDMNANNIITAEDGRAIMIDYRHTAVGPRVLDFAALETSIRLSSMQARPSIEEILKSFSSETASWKANWASTNRFPQNDREKPYWQQISAQLSALARMNFHDLSALEYACTCYGWVVRMLRVSLTFEERLRLICWMSQLSQVIETGKP